MTGMSAPAMPLLVTEPARPSGGLPRQPLPGLVLREVLLLGGLLLVYQASRLLGGRDVEAAFDHARLILAFEQWLGLPAEQDVQALLLSAEPVVRAANTFYAAAHLPVTALALLWLMCSVPAAYRRTRRALVGSTAIALGIYLLLPVAPPRMLAGFVDTASAHGQSVYGGAGASALANEYAALPSLHVGWAVLVALACISTGRTPWRWLWLLHPVVTVVVVVGTANRFWLDAVAGAVLVVAVWWGWSEGDPRPEHSGRRSSAPRPCRQQCCADDAGVVPQGSRPQRWPHVDQVQPLVGLLAHPATEHDEVGPQQPVDVPHVALEPRRPVRPAEVLPFARRVGCSPLGELTVQLQVPELGVGHQPSVDDQGAADARAEREDENGAVDPSRRSVPGFGEPGRVRVVDHDRSAARALLHQRHHVGADPGLVDVGGGADHPVHHDRREGQAEGPLRRTSSLEDLRHDVADSVGGCRLGGLDADPVRGQGPLTQVDGGALDAAPADVDAEAGRLRRVCHALIPSPRGA